MTTKVRVQDIEKDFHNAFHHIGIEDRESHFIFKNRRYRLVVSATPEVTRRFGNHQRAMKLIRRAKMVEIACSTPGNNHLFDIIRPSFRSLCDFYPVLRSNFEAARIGGAVQAWVKQ